MALSRRLKFPYALVPVFLFIATGLSQDAPQVGKKIYSESANSILLLYTKASDGSLTGLGTGFLIAGNKIVTNAHVANAGNIMVQFGPARVPAKLEKLDSFNDLAILTVDVEITVKPLTLAQKSPAPGEVAFAIGNPEGLEKTISQGVISGVRTLDGRELLQISAPLSHGSSGGPIFNSSGEVVGVAVGILSSGQNLNFAVPASLISKLLREVGASPPRNALATLDEITKLTETHQSQEYSAAADSPYQQTDLQIKTLLRKAYEEAGANASVLIQVAKAALTQDYDVAIDAAKRATEIDPTVTSSLLYAQSLHSKAFWQDQGQQKETLLKEAENAARTAMSRAHPPTYETYYTLADVLEDEGSMAEADKDFHAAFDAAPKIDSDEYANVLRALNRTAFALNKTAEWQHWFELLKETGKTTFFDWEADGKHLASIGDYADAAEAYRTAALANNFYQYWCLAADNYELSAQDDLLLLSARSCIETGTGKSGSEAYLAGAHREIADTLNKRGVYSEALNHAKEATVLIPSSAFAYDSMAVALIGLHRFEEAINPAQQAIRLSDGKYAFMHFNLGSAYFSLENWDFARQSFQKASELNTSEPASAYNVALCFVKLHYYRDAIPWYQEYLRRRPNAPDKDDVLSQIQKIRNL
jgi:hypothetical protein